MSDVNVPLLRKAVEWVEHQDQLPENLCQWYQGAWTVPGATWYNEQTAQYEVVECGTTYCVAGYIGQMVDERYKGSGWGGTEYDEDGGKHVSEVARDALGLTKEQAGRLFDGENDAEDVRRIAEEIAGERL